MLYHSAYAAEMHRQGNTLKISIETRDDDISGRDYLETLKHPTDDVFLLTGVERPCVASLWTTAARWASVTDDGFPLALMFLLNMAGALVPLACFLLPRPLACARSDIAASRPPVCTGA